MEKGATKKSKKKSKKKSLNLPLPPSNTGEESISSFWDDYYNVESEFSKTESEIKLSRTELLLLDYRQFKAARTIQTAFRGWYARRMLAKKRHAAIVIQREWRRFYSQRFYFRFLEDKVQNAIHDHYFRAAQKIQSLYRGHWIRQNVHDHTHLKYMQVCAAQELLYCVAFKLHHLIRTYHIPGIYSLRNTSALSKIEQLLSTMTFRQHNIRIRERRSVRDQTVQNAKRHHKQAVMVTTVPYPGPDYEGACDPQCARLLRGSYNDNRMYQIINQYEKSNRIDPRVKIVQEERFARLHPGKVKKVQSSSFCTDIIRSMRRWKILADNGITIDPNIVCNPKNLEYFLNDSRALYDRMKDHCHCRIQIRDDDWVLRNPTCTPPNTTGVSEWDRKKKDIEKEGMKSQVSAFEMRETVDSIDLECEKLIPQKGWMPRN